MVLKAGLEANPNLPPVPSQTQILTNFGVFPDQTGGRFSVQLVGPANPVKFLKP